MGDGAGNGKFGVEHQPTNYVVYHSVVVIYGPETEREPRVMDGTDDKLVDSFIKVSKQTQMETYLGSLKWDRQTELILEECVYI